MQLSVQIPSYKLVGNVFVGVYGFIFSAFPEKSINVSNFLAVSNVIRFEQRYIPNRFGWAYDCTLVESVRGSGHHGAWLTYTARG